LKPAIVSLISIEVQTIQARRFVSVEMIDSFRVNVRLEPGQLSDTVTVHAGAPTITTDTQTIAATFGSEEVLSLPTNYRGSRTRLPACGWIVRHSFVRGEFLGRPTNSVAT
jgi:hypothetical protein